MKSSAPLVLLPVDNFKQFNKGQSLMLLPAVIACFTQKQFYLNLMVYWYSIIMIAHLSIQVDSCGCVNTEKARWELSLLDNHE